MPVTAIPLATMSARTSRAVLGVRRMCLVLVCVAAALSLGAAAWGYWGNTGGGGSAAATGTLNAPSTVLASAPINSSTVAVNWSGATLATGQTASGYYVTRIRNSDGAPFPACGTSPSVPTPSLSCNDLGVTDGIYHYTVTALFGSWTAVSPPGNSVTVVNDSSLPSINVTSISPAPNGNGYNNTSPVTVNLSASGGAGILSITYTIDSGSPVTVLGATAAVSVSGDAIHTVTYYAKDLLQRVSQTGSVFVRIDRVAPAAPSAPVLAAASDSGSSSSDRITNVTTPTFSGTAEDGATVTLYDGATPVGSGTSAGGAYTIVSSTLTGAAHTMTAKATDPAGNVGAASAGTAVTIDTAAPASPPAPVLTAASDSGSSPTDRITNVTTPTFTGTAESGATVTLYNGTTVVGTAVAAGGAYSVTSTALNTGVKPMTVKATDAAGNTGPASASTSITIDITAPAKPGTPVLTAASDSGRSATDKITKVTTPTVTGSTTAGYLVTLYEGPSTALVQLGSTTAVTTAYSITSTTLTSAVHSITTRNTDVAGNLGPLSTAISVTVDTVAPAAPSVPKANAASDTGKSSTDGITKITKPVITGTNESKAIVTLFDGATQIGAVTTTTTTSSITSSTLAEGNHTLTATSTDIAGNLGPASAAGTLTIDTIAPTTSASTPTLTAASDSGVSSTDRITKTTTPVFTGTAGPGDTVTLFDGATITGTPVTASGGAYTATTATLTNGSHTITAIATDVAGNAAPTAPATTVTIDTVVPTVTINQATGQADPTPTSPINFTAAFSEPVAGFTSASVTYTGTALATTSTISGTGPSYNVAATGMTKTGTVIPAIAAAKVTDIAGNFSAAATFTDNTVTYSDTTAPLAPTAPFLAAASDTGSSSTDGITKVTTPTFTGTAETGSTVRLFDGVTQVGSVVAATGSYSIASSTLTNGTHTITATATDPTGNAGPASTGTTVTIDTIAPTVTLNQAAGQADPTTTSPINFTATFSEPVTGFSTGITYTGTALASTSAISGAGATYNVAASGMTKTGTVIPSLAASAAQDIAGNLSAAATYTDRTVTYTDNTAPTVVITSFAPDASQTATATGTAGFGPGDSTTVTVVFCTVNVFPCAAGNTRATLTPTINATTGGWSTTSVTLGTIPTLYAKATQTDLTGNIGNSPVAGPIAVP
ncbi:hypothetical protein GU243_03275 [Pseudarthrobacter psychrotolerans]|uniref:Bacterial Ig-like domain-containing protein n=1 Tax=Pseudarthrobacter psychrotolerans TaxID=2697569 RepID=A0A6P1NHB1_9MICC|nr:Ig-like domain-containing protein [Pseudarthrobacter psychrotolerans]QHK18939.1 hypothetical protein GU243_03275 [Pseudarthrobacter psychrotolerans]